MSVAFCVSNLPEDISDEAISALFAPLAPVTDIRRVVNPETNEFTRKVSVKLKPEENQSKSDLVRAVHSTLNGHPLGDPWLIVTLMYATSTAALPALNDAQREFVREVLAALGETDEIPTFQMTLMMRMFGEEFITHVLRETQTIEEAGGLMVQDGSRRRTLGGVFFYLARQYIRGSAWPLVFDLQHVRAQLDGVQPPKKAPKSPKSAAASKPANGPKPARRPDVSSQAQSSAPPATSPLVAPPVEREPLDEGTLQALRQQIADLRAEHQAAQGDLEAAKAGEIRPKEGVFALMKRVADTQREIDRLLRTYPELGE